MFYNQPVEVLQKSIEHFRTTTGQEYYELEAMFPQMWSSTALGFGGIGGQAMTTAYTVILCDDNLGMHVYFSGRFAYHIPRPSREFHEDVRARHMQAVGSTKKYRREENETAPPRERIS